MFLILALISEFGGDTDAHYIHHYQLLSRLYHLQAQELLLGSLISSIFSCLTSPTLWTTIIKSDILLSYVEDDPIISFPFLDCSIHVLLTLPILSGARIIMLGDLHSNTLLSDPMFGGDPIFYQHIFWTSRRLHLNTSCI